MVDHVSSTTMSTTTPPTVEPPRGDQLPTARVFDAGSEPDAALTAATVDRLLSAMDVLRATFEAVVAEVGLNLSQAMTLRHLDEPVAMREIAEQLACDPSYVTAIVDRLSELDAVERRPDPADRRVKLLHVTPEGERLRDELDRRLVARLPLAQVLGRERLEVLHDLLGGFAEVARAGEASG